MQKPLETLLNKFFLNYCSIPVVIVLCLISCIPFLPSNSNSSIVPLCWAIVVAISVIIVYLFFTIKNNILPKAAKNSKSILFVIDAETHQQFEEINYKLVKRFKDLLKENSTVKVDVKSIMRSQIKNYCVKDKSEMLRLLKKTNCIFIVDVVYIVDEESNANNYEIDIRTGVVHPEYEKIANTILQNELNILTQPLSTAKFTRNEKIDKFKLTALSLTYVSQYIIGILFLFSGLTELACQSFNDLYNIIPHENHNDSLLNWLKKAIPHRLYLTNIILAEEVYQCYRKNKINSDLDKMEQYLKTANMFIPSAYGFNLDMAIVYILKYKNIQGAITCIKKCKSFNDKRYNNWRYSEAFLFAYKQANPLTIYRKYNTAFKYDYNIVDLASFIEDVLIQEPDKFMLHLALGLIYEKAQNVILMKYHFQLFINKTKDISNYEQIIKIVNDKMSLYDCQAECDSNCQECKLIA